MVKVSERHPRELDATPVSAAEPLCDIGHFIWTEVLLIVPSQFVPHILAFPVWDLYLIPLSYCP